MPLAFTSSLTDFAKTNNYPYLLRMSPTDDKNVTKIANHILKNFPGYDVLFICDDNSEVYSMYIIDTLIKRLQSKTKVVGCNILTGTKSGAVFHFLYSNKHCCIVYAGMCSNGFFVADEVNQFNNKDEDLKEDKRIEIIFTPNFTQALFNKYVAGGEKVGIKISLKTNKINENSISKIQNQCYEFYAIDSLDLVSRILQKSKYISKKEFRKKVKNKKMT